MMTWEEVQMFGKKMCFCVLTILLCISSIVYADFQFLVFTDTHILYPTGYTNPRAQAAVTMVNSMSPAPKFVANPGDMAEAGLRREYDMYKSIVKNFNSSIALYEGSPGNHDSIRGAGSINYRERVGAARSSFMYDVNGNHSSAAGFDPTKAYHFLLLNGAMCNNGDDGHMSRPELDWIKSTLDASPVASIGGPVVCFLHHPVDETASTMGEGRYVDNARVLVELLKNYNVTLMLYGHVHSKKNYTGTNDNVSAFSFDGVMDENTAGSGIYGGVGVINISPSKIEVRDYPTNGTLSAPRGTINLPAPRYPKITFNSPVNDEYLTDTTKAVSVKIELYQGHIAGITSAYYQIDDGGCPATGDLFANTYFKPMTVVQVSSSVATATANVDFAACLAEYDALNSRTLAAPWYQINGIHRLKVRFDTTDGKKWYRNVWVNVNVRKTETDDYARASVWRKDVGADIQADMAVANNNLYLNPYGRYAFCYDINGTEIWKFDKNKYGEALEESSGPAVDGQTVVFGSYNGNLFAVDASSGALKWRYTVPDDPANEVSLGYPDSPTSIYGTPRIDNGVVYFGAIDGDLYAVNLTDGKLKWKYDGRATTHGGSVIQGHKEMCNTPVIFNNAVYFTNWSGYMHAVTLAGAKKWESLVATSFYYAPAISDPVISGGCVFGAGAPRSGYTAGLICVDSADGTVKWSTQNSQATWNSLGVNEAGTHVYIKSTNGYMRAYTVASGGSPVWNVRLYDKAGEAVAETRRSRVIEKDGVVYGPSRFNGLVFAVKDNGNSGSLYWKYRAGVGTVTSAMVPYGERVYVGTCDGHLMALGRVSTKAPNPPTDVTAVATGIAGQIRVIWKPSSTGDASAGYRLYRSNSNTGPWDNTTKMLDQTVETSYIDTGLTNRTRYYYVVKAFNNIGDSAVSAVASAEPVESITKPNAPFNLQTKNNGKSGMIELWWSAPVVDTNHTAAIGYTVWESTTYSSGYDSVMTSTVTFSTRIGLVNSTTYYFKIKAFNSAGESDQFSNVSFMYPINDVSPPGVPAGFSAVNTSEGGKVKLSWSVVSALDLQEYRLYRSEVSGNYDSSKVVAVISKTLTSYTDLRLENGKKYYYVLTSVDSTNKNESMYSSEVTAIPTGVGEKPIPPANLALTDLGTGGSLSLRWDSVENTEHYKLYRGNQANGVYSIVVATGIKSETYIDTGLLKGTTYFYKVRSADNAGNVSDDSSMVSGYTTGVDTTVPTAVQGLEVSSTDDGGEIKVAWNASTADEDDIAGYRVYYSSISTSGPFELLAMEQYQADIASQDFVHVSLVNGVTYYYTVTAYDTSGNESTVLPATGTYASCSTDMIAPAVPGIPQLVTVASGKQLLVNWTESADTDVAEYRIYRSETGENGTYSEVNVVKKGFTSVTDSGLKNNVPYWYRIIAVDAKGNPSGYTQSVQGTPVDSEPPETQDVKTVPSVITKLGQLLVKFAVTEPLKADPVVKINNRIATRTSMVIQNAVINYTYAYILKETDLVSGQVLNVQVDMEDEAGLKKSNIYYVSLNISKTENLMRVMGNKLDGTSNAKAVIQYYLVEDASFIRLKVYNMAGELVKIINGDQKNGWGAIEWDGTNEENKKVSNGIYFTYLESNVFKQTGKVVVIR